MRPMCQVKQKLVLTRLWKIEGEKELTESDHSSRKHPATESDMTVTGYAHTYAMWILLGLHGFKWLCLFFGQQQVFRTHGTISIIWT